MTQQGYVLLVRINKIKTRIVKVNTVLSGLLTTIIALLSMTTEGDNHQFWTYDTNLDEMEKGNGDAGLPLEPPVHTRI